MIPRIVNGITWNTGLHPVCAGVVPDVPLVTARDATLMSPDESFATKELVDVEFERLR